MGKTYLNRFLEYLIANMHQPVIMLVGKKVQGYQQHCKILWKCVYAPVFSGIPRKKADLLL